MRRRLVIVFEVAIVVGVIVAGVVSWRTEHHDGRDVTLPLPISVPPTTSAQYPGPDPVATQAMIDFLNVCLTSKGSTVRLSPALTTILDAVDRAAVDDCGRTYVSSALPVGGSPVEASINACLLQHGATATIKLPGVPPPGLDRQILGACLGELVSAPR